MFWESKRKVYTFALVYQPCVEKDNDILVTFHGVFAQKV